MSRLKDFLKNINFISKCCNTEYDHDYDWEEERISSSVHRVENDEARVIKRLEMLARETHKSLRHLEEMRALIKSLLERLDHTCDEEATAHTALLPENK